MTAVENVKNHVVESEETVKSVKSALERVNNQVAVLGQAVVESGDISTKTITFAALQYNVKFKAELENYTQYDLHPSRTEIISGKISDPPTAIKRGGKNGVVGHKTGGACRGCVGTMGSVGLIYNYRLNTEAVVCCVSAGILINSGRSWC